MLKRNILRKLEALALSSTATTAPSTVYVSTTSTLKPSLIAAEFKFSSHFLVVHPVNPPLLCPLVELVPSSDTQSEVVNAVHFLFSAIGQVCDFVTNYCERSAELFRRSRF